MPVLLEGVTVNNFRSIASMELSLSPYTPLIGYNNSGKTNAISAIQWLLRKAVLSKADFLDPSLAVEVEGKISGIEQAAIDAMPSRQQVQIQPYIINGELTFKRTQPSPASRATEITLSVLNPTTNDWAPNPTGIDNALSALMPEPIRIAAMQDAAEDSAKAKTSTTIGKLLAEFLEPVRSAHETELSKLLNEVDRRLSSDGDARFAELLAIESQISTKIADMFPGIGARLHFPVPAMEDLIKAGTLRLYEVAGASRDFSSYGHGTQRSVQMALIRHLAEIRRGASAVQGTTLLLIDEPELYLHPFAVEQVRGALKSLSAAGYQVIFSTHSAQLVAASDAQYTLLMRKSVGQPTHTRRRLIDAIQVVVPNSTHQMEQLFTLSNSSQVLFADRAILAEGKTELRLIPFLHEVVRGTTLGHQKCALVTQSGVNDTKKSMEILAAMDIPCKAIVDLDYAFSGAVRDGFLQSTDTDLASLKATMARMATDEQISIDFATGLPRKGITRPSEAYALLARDPGTTAAIASLHEKLLVQNIWLWKRGAVEAHLGTNSKNESEWARLQADVSTKGIDNVCPDAQSIRDMLAWLAS